MESSSAINEVRLTFGNLSNKTIKAARGNGTDTTGMVKVRSHLFSDGTYNTSKPNKVWDAYTTLELMYTGSEWLVMGNPVLCSHYSETLNYTVFANGMIEQRGVVSASATFPVKFFKTPFVTLRIYAPSTSSDSKLYPFIYTIDVTGLQVKVKWGADYTVSDNTDSIRYKAEGF